MSRSLSLALVLVAGCRLFNDSAIQPPSEPLPEWGHYAHVWTVERHQLAKRPLITDVDAAMWEGHEIIVQKDGSYQTPWQGHCTDAKVKVTNDRKVADVAAAVEIPAPTIEDFGLSPYLTEYRFTCRDTRTPMLVLYVANSYALTCWSGACYFLSHDEKH